MMPSSSMRFTRPIRARHAANAKSSGDSRKRGSRLPRYAASAPRSSARHSSGSGTVQSVGASVSRRQACGPLICSRNIAVCASCAMSGEVLLLSGEGDYAGTRALPTSCAPSAETDFALRFAQDVRIIAGSRCTIEPTARSSSCRCAGDRECAIDCLYPRCGHTILPIVISESSGYERRNRGNPRRDRS